MLYFSMIRMFTSHRQTDSQLQLVRVSPDSYCENDPSNVILADEPQDADISKSLSWKALDIARVTLYGAFPFFLVALLWTVAHYHRYSNPPSYFPAEEGAEMALQDPYLLSAQEDGCEDARQAGTSPNTADLPQLTSGNAQLIEN